ncbi:hypothetical protein ACFL0D_08985, partial [Thermoproteota archaeon]
TQPILTDLQVRLQDLEDDYDALETQYNELSSDNSGLEQQLETLKVVYAELQAEKESLFKEQLVLIEQLEAITKMYESLLEDYETSLGRLNFSNQTIPVIQRNYTWTHSDVSYSLDIAIPELMYEYYSTKDRYHTSDYRGYILHPYDDEFIEVIVKEFEKISVLNNMKADDELGLITSFVQNLHYLTDDKTNFDDYPKFPAETLVDNGGDCEDTSILLAHILEAMDIDTVLLTLPGHMAIGVDVNATGVKWELENNTYYYLETTAIGWGIGKIPTEHIGKEAEVLEIIKIPFITHTWEATRQNNVVDVTVIYTNEAPFSDSGYRAWVGMELDSGVLYAEKIGDPLDLMFGESDTQNLIIEGPRHDNMRIIIGVLTPSGEVITQKYSQYFNSR